MNLNNHGWSLKEMIIYCGIMLAFLLVAIFFIIRLYSGLNSSGVTDKSPIVSYSYSEIEAFVLEAGLDYYNEYYDKAENTVITTAKLKKHGYLSSDKLKAEGETKSCSGYVEVIEGSAQSYIKCGAYMTMGYEE